MRRSIGGRKSIGGGRRSSIGSGLRSPGGQAAPEKAEKNAATLRDMYSKINDIIQLSSENKINSKNAWNLGVDMDSFMESALDEGIVEDKENERAIAKQGGEVMRRRKSGGFARAGVNFQKASVKLDASVKIYSARVDDTHTNSYRILENLNRSGQSDPDGSGSDTSKATSAAGDKAMSNKLSIAKTLEKSPDSLNAPPAAELQVDPSFHKMSSLFDEGGAEGMLLYNLALEPRGGCTVAFADSQEASKAASSTTATTPDAGAASPAAANGSSNGGAAATSAFQMLDVSALSARTDRAIEELLAKQGGSKGSGGLEALALCPSLSDFRAETAQLTGKPYALGAPTPYKPSSASAAAAAAGGSPAGSDVSPVDEHDWSADDDDDSFGDDNGDPADLALDFGDDDNGFGDDDDEDSFVGPGQASPLPNKGSKHGGGGSAMGRQALESVLQLDSGAFFAEGGNDYAFFDPLKLDRMNLWAGATHWKFGQQKRAVPTKADHGGKGDDGDDNESGGAQEKHGADRKKVRKGALTVDFNPLPDPDEEAMLEAKVLAMVALPVPKKPAGPTPKTAKGKAAAQAKADAAMASATQLSAAALTKVAAAAASGAYALPANDAGLAPRDLKRLFLRPEALVSLSGGNGGGGVRWGSSSSGGVASSWGDQPSHGSFNFNSGSAGHGNNDGYGDEDNYGGHNDFDAANDDSFGDDNDFGGPGFTMAERPYGGGNADDDDVDASRMLAPDRKV